MGLHLGGIGETLFLGVGGAPFWEERTSPNTEGCFHIARLSVNPWTCTVLAISLCELFQKLAVRNAALLSTFMYIATSFMHKVCAG